MKPYLLGLAALCMGSTATAQTDTLRATRNATLGVYAVDLATGRTVLDRHATLGLTPASLTKVITTATALRMLSTDFRFETWIKTDAPVVESRLRGDLCLMGEGDPTAESRFLTAESDALDDLARQVRAHGITEIEGDLVALTGNFDTESTHPLWLKEDLGTYFGMATSALPVGDNTLTLTLRRQDGRVVADYPMEGDTIDCRVEVQDRPRDLALIGQGTRRTLVGNIKSNVSPTTPITIKCDMGCPELTYLIRLRAALERQGVMVSGGLRVSRETPMKSGEILARHVSAPLGDIIRETNFRSLNLYAEQLGKRLSLTADSLATWEGMREVVASYWTSQGVDWSGVNLYDGSGLSPKNELTPRAVVEVLTLMAADSVWRASLPLAGRDGTVKNVARALPQGWQVRMKSGSFRGVQGYAGYLTRGRDTIVFCLMANHFGGTRRDVIAWAEAVLNDIVARREGMDDVR